jgi:WD40 repeat protein
VGHQGGLLLVYDFPKIKLVAEVELKPDRTDTNSILSGTSKPILDYVVMVVCPSDLAKIFVALEFRDFFCLLKDNLNVTTKKHHPGNIIEQTAVSPKGNMIFFGDDLGCIYRFILADMRMIMFADHHEIVNAFDSSMRPSEKDTSIGIACLALSKDGRQLASTSFRGGVQIWDTEGNNSEKKSAREFLPLAAKQPMQTGRTRGVSFHPNSSNVIIGSDDGTVEVWNYSTEEIIYHTNCQEGVRSLDVSPVDAKCAMGCKDGSIFLFPWPGAHNQKYQNE